MFTLFNTLLSQRILYFMVLFYHKLKNVTARLYYISVVLYFTVVHFTLSLVGNTVNQFNLAAIKLSVLKAMNIRH